MINIALIDPELAAAVNADQETRGAVRDLTVVWSGSDIDALMKATFSEAPDVVVLDRARLPAEPTATLEALRRRIPARSVITTYVFATRGEIDTLRKGGSDIVLQGPLSVRTLRTFLLSLLIERRVQRAAAPTPTSTTSTSAAPTSATPQMPGAASASASAMALAMSTMTPASGLAAARLPEPRAQRSTPPPGPNAESGPVMPPRYPRPVLIALRDLSTAIQCECPNHVSELVERLVAFEAYSKGCENRDDKDAEVHRALWFATARARRIMEDALEQLLKHEGFVVEGDTVRRKVA